MKFLSALLLGAGLVSSEWTCEECTEGGAALGEYTTSDEAIAGQVEVLLGAICRTVFSQYWHHVCDDIEECAQEPRTLVPECGECFGRIGLATEALGDPEVQDMFIQGLGAIDFCGTNYPDTFDQCREGVKAVVPQALAIFATYPQDWIQTFCTDVWGC